MNDLFKGVQANDSKDLVNFIIMTLHEEMNKAPQKLKNDFSIYRDQTEELIKNQDKEINELKKSNSLYLNIIKRLKIEYAQNDKKDLKEKLNNEEENAIILNEIKEGELNENDEEELK